MQLHEATFPFLKELGEAFDGVSKASIASQSQSLINPLIFVYSSIFKRKRRCPKTGKVKTAKTYSGRYRLSLNSELATVPLHTSDKQVARKMLDEIIKREQRKAYGILPDNIGNDRSTLFEQNLKDYVSDMRGRNLSNGHIYTVEKRLNRLALDCGWKYLGDMTSMSFMQWRSKKDIAASTKNQYLEYLQTFCSWCLAHNPLCQTNPMANVDRLNEKGQEVRKRRNYTNVEIEQLLQVVGKHRGAYLAAFYTGLRRGELNALEWRHVDLSSDPATISLEGRYTKNGEDAYIVLHSSLVEVLKELKPEGASPEEKVFSREIMPSYYMVRKHRQAAGIPYRNENNRVVDFHALRHTLATHLAANNVSPHLAQKIMRHSDLSMTSLYTHTTTEGIERAIVGLPAFNLCPKESGKGGESPEEKWTPIGTQHADSSCHDLSLIDQIGVEESGAQLPDPEGVGLDLTQIDHSWQTLQMAALLGLEPRQTDPESVVLPLHHKAIGGFLKEFRERSPKGKRVGSS